MQNIKEKGLCGLATAIVMIIKIENIEMGKRQTDTRT